jgi:citrate lyase subunit beta / citryl-CoA lyase
VAYLTPNNNRVAERRSTLRREMSRHSDLGTRLNRASFELASIPPWPGIQLYYPPVKYVPTSQTYETLEMALQRFHKHAENSRAQTLIFDLEDGCREKESSRNLLRQLLPSAQHSPGCQIAIRVNKFRSEQYRHDLALVSDIIDHVDVVMLPKAGDDYGIAEIADLSSFLSRFSKRLTIQPIIEHPKSFQIAGDLLRFPTVHHIVFGVHDFSRALGISITASNWLNELRFFLNQLILEARLARKGVIGGVETMIGSTDVPEHLTDGDDFRHWLNSHGDDESNVVYRHAREEAALGLTGKQVIHPRHIRICTMAFTPSRSDVIRQIDILEAAIAADALHGGAIRFHGEMLDPPHFGIALQLLLKTVALRGLPIDIVEKLESLLIKVPDPFLQDNWPYGYMTADRL